MAFRFSPINIEYDSLCLYDRLDLFDGDTSQSPVLASLCGTQLPSVMHSSTNRVLVRFVTDSLLVGSGFFMEFRAQLRAAYGNIYKKNVFNFLENLKYPLFKK